MNGTVRCRCRTSPQGTGPGDAIAHGFGACTATALRLVVAAAMCDVHLAVDRTDYPLWRELRMSPLRLLLVDDHQIVLDGLKAMLDPHRGRVEVVGETSDPQDAMRLVAECLPDIVLLDVRLHRASGLDVCAELLRRYPGCKVAFLTVYDDEQYLYQALRLHAAGSCSSACAARSWATTCYGSPRARHWWIRSCPRVSCCPPRDCGRGSSGWSSSRLDAAGERSARPACCGVVQQGDRRQVASGGGDHQDTCAASTASLTCPTGRVRSRWPYGKESSTDR